MNIFSDMCALSFPLQAMTRSCIIAIVLFAISANAQRGGGGGRGGNGGAPPPPPPPPPRDGGGQGGGGARRPSPPTTPLPPPDGGEGAGGLDIVAFEAAVVDAFSLRPTYGEVCEPSRGPCPEADSIGGLVRLTFHDCVGGGGCNGCVDFTSPENNGLQGNSD